MDDTEILRRFENMIRFGTVEQLRCTQPPAVRVRSGDLLSNWLPWLTARAGADSEWWPPEIGEQVVMFCPGGEPTCGVVLPGIFSDVHPAPSSNPTERRLTFADGAMVSYDRERHTLLAKLPQGGSASLIAPGSVTVKSPSVMVQADLVSLHAKQTTCSGNLLVKGALAYQGGMSGKGGRGTAATIEGVMRVSEDVVVGGTSTRKHRHGGIERGGQISDGPQ